MADATKSGPLAPADGTTWPRRGRGRRRRRRSRLSARERLLIGVALACLGFVAVAAWDRFTEPTRESRDGPVALCSVLERRTCLIDGHTGRDNGRKWRDVSRILLQEGLAQKWPNRGNIWCDRYTGTPLRPSG